MRIKLLHNQIPPEMLSALERSQLKYTPAEDLVRCIGLGEGSLCGVFGDSDNGAYEWFIWSNGKAVTSDLGYGDPDVALRDVLAEVVRRGE